MKMKVRKTKKGLTNSSNIGWLLSLDVWEAQLPQQINTYVRSRGGLMSRVPMQLFSLLFRNLFVTYVVGRRIRTQKDEGGITSCSLYYGREQRVDSIAGVSKDISPSEEKLQSRPLRTCVEIFIHDDGTPQFYASAKSYLSTPGQVLSLVAVRAKHLQHQ